MPSAYSQIPPDRPASEEEALDLYRPVVNYFVSRARPSLFRDYQDIRQDAFLGVIEAWRKWDPARAGTFKSWAVFMVRQWVFSKGSTYFGFNVFNARSRGSYIEKKAVLEPCVRLDEVPAGWDENRYRYLLDLGIADISDSCLGLGLDFDSLVGMVGAERSRSCLRQYYLKGRTLEEIGMELDVSRERVRQLLEKAYLEIKKGLEQKQKLIKALPDNPDNGGNGGKAMPEQPQSCRAVASPLPLRLTMATNVERLAGIALVNKRTMYRWVDAHGKEAVVEICNRVLQEFGGVVKPSDLAKAFAVSVSTIYRLVANGKIRSLNFFGDTIRIPVSEVRRLLDEAVARGGVMEPRAMTDLELKGLFANVASRNDA